MIEGSNFVGLSDLLDQDTTSYEFFYSLPRQLQDEIRKQDFMLIFTMLRNNSLIFALHSCNCQSSFERHQSLFR